MKCSYDDLTCRTHGAGLLSGLARGSGPGWAVAPGEGGQTPSRTILARDTVGQSREPSIAKTGEVFMGEDGIRISGGFLGHVAGCPLDLLKATDSLLLVRGLITAREVRLPLPNKRGR